MISPDPGRLASLDGMTLVVGASARQAASTPLRVTLLSPLGPFLGTPALGIKDAPSH